MTITWKEFARLITSGKYKDGAAHSAEPDGDFAGPIDGITADKNGAAVAVKPCATRDGSKWRITFPKGRLISEFRYYSASEPSLDDHGGLSYYIFQIGTVHIYPKDHPKAKALLAIGKQAAA